MYPKSIKKLIDQFSKFPTVGPRTAARFVFYLLRAPKEEISNLVELISNLSKEVKETIGIPKLEIFNREIEELYDIIVCELKSKSVHLYNIFSFTSSFNDNSLCRKSLTAHLISSLLEGYIPSS